MKPSCRTLLASLLVAAALLSVGPPSAPAQAAKDKPARKKIVLVAGPKSHGPVGNGIHDYGWSVKLLKVMLDNSNVKDQVQVEVHLDGWPKDPKTLEDADTLMIVSDGRDGDKYEEAPHLASEERVRFVDKQMKRGCGFVTFHFSTFAPEKYRDQMLDWCGGYFQWETDGKRQWYSAITTKEAEVQLGAPDHPVARGLKPFTMKEEFYYNLRFKAKDDSLKPLWSVPALNGRKDDGNVVAWARERPDGGRGFGTTCGHFYDNWKQEQFRTLILNALVWSAKLEVPKDGVQAKFYTHDEIKAALGQAEAPAGALTEGCFAQALDARKGGATIAGKPEYRKPPLTVECWARLFGKKTYNIVVASELKSAPTHWELFTMPGSGKLTAYLPGRKPDHVHSDADICDGRWHYLALTIEPERVRLFVDGKSVAEQAVQFKGGEPTPGDLAIGMLVGRELGCDGLVDEVRLSDVVREIKSVPEAPFTADGQTVGLWHFDKSDGGLVTDESKLKNPAKLAAGSPPPNAQGPTPPDGLNFQPADPRLKAVHIDRSSDEAYLAVKTDSEGRLFVAAREAVFVFEPDGKGGYRPRQEVCRFPADSILIGLEWRGNDLYALSANALYLLPEGRIKRGVKPKRLVWGLPLDLHVSFHCLAWGPEGDLYLDHGDPLLNFGDFDRPDHWGHWTLYTQPEGTKVSYTGTGAVLRVRPDGSNLRVVAGGLRGPVGLAFDRHWELFSNDNDHESRADLYAPCRLLHVTPGADFAWPRGWMASKSPDRADLLEPMNADLGRGVPCDLAYYDEPFFPAEYRHALLMDRWDRMTVHHYPLAARGASFAAKELPFLEGRHQARPVGVCVGRGGRVFVTALYLGGNVWSPHCYSDLVMVTRADDPAECPFEPYDAVTAPAEKLWAELSNPSWERRGVAHKEILRRGGPLLEESTRRLATVKDTDPALMHLPWLAGVGGSAEARRLLEGLMKHPRPEVRLQAVRVLAEFPALKAPRQVFVAALADESPRIRLAALPWFLHDSDALPLAAVVKLAESPDSYLRQAAVQMLARRATLADLKALAESPAASSRLAGVLAAGIRLTVPAPDYVPPEKMALTYPHGNAHFTLTYAAAPKPVDLRAIGRVGSFTTAQWWKAIDPTADQQALFQHLMNALEDEQPPVQLQAAFFLSLLRDARSEGRIAQVRQAVIIKGLAAAPLRGVEKAWLVGPFADGAEGLRPAHPPEQGVIDLTAEYPGKRTWQQVASKDGRFDKLPAGERTSSYLYFQLQSVRRQPVVLQLGPEDEVQVWHNGRALAASVAPGKGPPSYLLDAQPGSNDVLVRVHAARTPRGVELRYRAAGGMTAALPEKLDSATLALRLKESGGAEKVPPEFLQVDWEKERSKGDAVRGRKLFGSLGCAKCHAITAEQKGGGAPSLAEARRRFTVAHLVESILLPSKQVAEPFRATMLSLTDGKVITGLVVQESDGELELLLPDASRKTIRKKDIEERTRTQVSPMPAGLVKTPDELRDLLAYLLSDNPLPP